MTSPALATRQYQGLTIPVPGAFTIDPAHTRVGFVARHLMVSKVRGHFGGVSGELVIAEDPVQSTVEVTLETASIDTGVADRDGHLRSPDFLDVEKFPTITFRSTRVELTGDNEFAVTGELTVRDVTREVVLETEFEGVALSPWATEVVGFTASFEIDREEFGITWNQALETGGVLVGKKVKVEISAEAIRKTS